MIKTETIKQALEIATPEEQMRIRLLNQAVAENLQAYKSKYSTANLNAWRSAEKELTDYVEKLFMGQEDTAPLVYLANLNKVLLHLKSKLWKVSSTTLYNHRKKLFIKPDEKGRYLVSDVDLYAEQYLKRLDGRAGESESKDIKDKRQAEIRKAKAQAKHWEIKAKIAAGLYVPRENFERELASRASVFKSDLLSFCRSMAPDIIHLVKGDDDLAPDLIDYMTEQTLVHLDRYSRTTHHESEGTIDEGV